MDEGVESDGRFEWMVVPTCDEKVSGRRERVANRTFRFKLFRVGEKGCKEVLEGVWGGNFEVKEELSSCLVSQLKEAAVTLREWRRSQFKNIDREVKRAMEAFEKMGSRAVDGRTLSEAWGKLERC
ncbi:hypothetical protein M9H77_17859 [Catharanthus roseus]|uniref:Uncharacterized protein n=1 Tax=Catharanthus roseus TaxID=4058 RepID=A0ACC0B5U2_CATRO|nr:hypothetical protein M9H77_17859 [Catharanthus roseus]